MLLASSYLIRLGYENTLNLMLKSIMNRDFRGGLQKQIKREHKKNTTSNVRKLTTDNK